MFFLHPKSEVEKESNELTNRFFKYLGFGALAIALMRLSPKLLRRD
jgi:hypothetical protein